MILQALLEHYEALAQKGEIARPGWGKVRVQYALQIDEQGRLCAVLPLEGADEKGKPIRRFFELPVPVKRTSGVAANFLWDNAAYLLGIDSKGKPEHALRCFEAAKALHLALLGELDDPFARALTAFYSSWDPASAADDPLLTPHLPAMQAGANLTFMFSLRLPDGEAALAQAWQTHYDRSDADEKRMRCLVIGESAAPELVHPAIKNVRGAQSAGATLVSFNARAFESYGRDEQQGRNAPVSKYAAFGYTTALNHLLADSLHVKLIGDTTVVYWAEGGGEQYQSFFSCSLDGETVTDNDLSSIMEAISQGRQARWDDLPLDPANRFYVLGLSPNAARLSVRFFLQSSFGDFVRNLKAHYARLEIVRPEFDKDVQLPLWRLLRETVNPNARDKSASPQMAGDTLRAVLSGGNYPATLYQNTLLRIRAEREVTRGKAAIIKAYILKNSSDERIKEAATVALNEQNNTSPYVLGRLFSLLEYIQNSASGATTVKDRYLNSACTTPGTVFPLLLKLKNSHTKVLMRDKPGLCITLERDFGLLMDKLDDSFPTHLTLEQQGTFMLGYYHQTQKRYEKKDNKEE